MVVRREARSVHKPSRTPNPRIRSICREIELAHPTGAAAPYAPIAIRRSAGIESDARIMNLKSALLCFK